MKVTIFPTPFGHQLSAGLSGHILGTESLGTQGVHPLTEEQLIRVFACQRTTFFYLLIHDCSFSGDSRLFAITGIQSSIVGKSKTRPYRELLLLHLQVLHCRASLLRCSYGRVGGLLASLRHLVHRRLCVTGKKRSQTKGREQRRRRQEH